MSQDYNNKNAIEFYKQSHSVEVTRFYIDEEIQESPYYRDLYQELLSASECDTVQLFISSNGGLLDTTLNIIECIRCSPAKVQAWIMGQCHSGASMIALACDEAIVLDSAYMMCHTSSFGTVGKSPDNVKHVNFVSEHTNRMIEMIYKDFLTDGEIEAMQNGQDFWFNAEQISERLKKRQEIRDAREEGVSNSSDVEVPLDGG